jgi:hypothetical protein
LQKISKSEADIFWLIADIQTISDPSYGDGIGIQMTLKNMLYVDGPTEGGLQGVRGVLEKFISLPRNPFA